MTLEGFKTSSYEGVLWWPGSNYIGKRVFTNERFHFPTQFARLVGEKIRWCVKSTLSGYRPSGEHSVAWEF